MAADHVHLLPKINSWIPQVLREIVPDEELSWESSFQVLPDPTIDDAWIPVLIVYIEMPLPSGETSIYSVTLLPPFGITEDTVRSRIIEGTTELIGRKDNMRHEEPAVVEMSLPDADA